MIELLRKKKQVRSPNSSFFEQSDIKLAIPSYFHEFDDDHQEESILEQKSYHYKHSKINNFLQSSLFLHNGARWTITLLIFLGRCALWALDQVILSLRLYLAIIILVIIVPANYCCGKEIDKFVNKNPDIFIPLGKFILNILGLEPEMDEPQNMFNEKVQYLNSLITQEQTLRSGGHQIPGRLTNEIHEAKLAVVVLEQILCVIPEYKAKYFYTDAERITPSQIKNLVSETYLKPTFPIEKPDVCSLCIKEFRAKEVFVRLSCQDKFHKECLANWLKQIPECPNCKRFVQLPQN